MFTVTVAVSIGENNTTFTAVDPFTNETRSATSFVDYQNGDAEHFARKWIIDTFEIYTACHGYRILFDGLPGNNNTGVMVFEYDFDGTPERFDVDGHLESLREIAFRAMMSTDLGFENRADGSNPVDDYTPTQLTHMWVTKMGRLY